MTQSAQTSASKSSRRTADVSPGSTPKPTTVRAGYRRTMSKTATAEWDAGLHQIVPILRASVGIITSTDGPPATDPSSAGSSQSESADSPESWICRSKYLGQTCDLPLVETTYGWGHTEPRRWAHSPVAKRVASADQRT